MSDLSLIGLTFKSFSIEFATGINEMRYEMIQLNHSAVVNIQGVYIVDVKQPFSNCYFSCYFS